MEQNDIGVVFLRGGTIGSNDYMEVMLAGSARYATFNGRECTLGNVQDSAGIEFSGGVMSTKTEQRTYEDAVAWLRDHGFDVLEAPGTKSRVFVKKLGCSAAIEKADDGGTKVFARPGYLIG